MTKRTSFRRSAQSTYGWLAVGALLLVGLLLYPWLGRQFYPLWLVASSLVTFGFFRYDKGQAQSPGAPRVPEFILLALMLVGGAVGGLAGMYLRPRHKTNKPGFVLTLAVGLLLHAYLLYMLVLA